MTDQPPRRKTPVEKLEAFKEKKAKIQAQYKEDIKNINKKIRLQKAELDKIQKDILKRQAAAEKEEMLKDISGLNAEDMARLKGFIEKSKQK